MAAKRAPTGQEHEPAARKPARRPPAKASTELEKADTPIRVPSTRADGGPAKELALRTVAGRLGATGTTHQIQTTMEPTKTITVSETEYQQLLAQGLVYSGSPVAPVADFYDNILADKVAHGSAFPTALGTEASDSASPFGSALRAAFASAGRRSLTVFHDFTGLADGPLTGSTQQGDLAWTATGPQPPTISGGRLISTGVGYAYVTAPEAPTILACGVEFTNPGSDAPMTMAWITGDTWDLTNIQGHCNFGGNGFAISLKRGATLYPLLEGEWKRPLSAGIVHTASVSIVGDSFVLQVDGEVYASQPDSRTRALVGSTVFWEPNVAGSSQAKVAWVGAWTATATGVPLPNAVASEMALYFQGLEGRVVGNRNEVWHAQLGRTPLGGMPGVSFGADTIFTELTSAVTAGATTIPTRIPLPPGCTVVVEQGGAAEETVTSTGWPSETSSPYTVALTGGLASDHATGSVVVATVPADRRAEMYLNQSNGCWYMPNIPVVVFPGGNVYVGGDLTQFVTKAASGVIGTDGVGAGKGAFRAGNGWATAARPLPSDVGIGSQGYDTDLQKPIWSDGTNWRDAAGTIV